MSKTWFVTGSNRGFGRAFVKAALDRGDRVAATSRHPEALADLSSDYGDRILTLAVDVTDRAAVKAAVAKTVETFGGIDVVVNNAGYGLFGAVEEISEEQLRRQLDVNLFGVFHVLKEVLPVLRTQRRGHIIQISTIGGVAAFPNLGGYHASKWALEGLTESLAQEVGSFGIKVTLVEPNGYATDWSGNSADRGAAMAEYEGMRKALAERFASAQADAIGDPTAAAQALLKIVDADEPPLRVLFGTMAAALVPQIYAGRLETWKAWEDLSREAHGVAG